jgi:hypothetical protein
MRKLIDDWKLVLLLCLTLGLAPFFPEPHIWGKLKWILGGGHGMAAIDWWDTFQHGVPFLLLFRLILKSIFFKDKKKVLRKEHL